MARSPLLWLSAALVVLALAALSLRLRQGEEISPLEEREPPHASAAESDTAQETLNTLVAEIRVMQREVQTLRDENHAMEEELRATRNRVERLGGGAQQAMERQLRSMEKHLESVQQEERGADSGGPGDDSGGQGADSSEWDAASSGPGADSDEWSADSDGWDAADGGPGAHSAWGTAPGALEETPEQPRQVTTEASNWVVPLDTLSPWPVAAAGRDAGLSDWPQEPPAFFDPPAPPLAPPTAVYSPPTTIYSPPTTVYSPPTAPQEALWRGGAPASYEIPAHTMLFEARALTALIGRVSVSSAEGASLPVKLVVRVSQVAGLDIPGLDSIVFAGRATGDWGLSCVRVQLDGAQYRFADGATGVVEAAASLGWVSDRWGMPCVPGKRFSNAPQAVLRDWLLAMASGYAAAFQETQTTRSVSDEGASQSTVTGNAYDYAGAEAFAEGIEEARDFFAERLENTFDAVYAPPGTQLVVHLARTLRLRHPSGTRLAVYGGGDGPSGYPARLD